MKNAFRRIARRMGYDIYRYPYGCERLLPHLSMLFGRYKIDTVVDVGANIGQFASEIRSIDRFVPIHSVEPNPYVYKMLESAARGDNYWMTYECALGSARGRATLNISTSSDFSSLLCANEFGVKRFKDDLEVEKTIEVDLKTLDELMYSISGRHVGCSILLKMDTQGFDMEVLKGGGSVINRVSVIVTEASFRPIYQGAPLFADVIEFMGQKGFLLSGFFPVSRNEDLSVIEADCVFVRPSSG